MECVKKLLEALRWVLLGFVPAMCVFGLIFGFFFAWTGTRASLYPQEAALAVREEEPGRWIVAAAGMEREIAPASLLEDSRIGEIAARYPVFVPHTVRLLAWCGGEIRENWPLWEEYLREIFTK